MSTPLTLNDLSQASYVSLKTCRKTGISVATPVWWAMSNDQVGYVFSAGEAGKIKRLRQTSKAELALCDVRGKILGPWVTVTAEVVSDSESVTTALRALRAKYGWQMKIADIGSKLTGRFNTRAYIQITAPQFSRANPPAD
jgi:PPOX class probable F420-dependent enzyme